MIKKYIKYTESIKNLLVGPSEEEVWDNLNKLSPNDLLKTCSKNGILKGVKLALDNGANVNIGGGYSLRWSSSCGHIDIVRLLLDNGADVHANNDESLRAASKFGNTDVVKLLLERGADIKSDKYGALNLARKNGHISTVSVLNNHRKYLEYLNQNESVKNLLVGPTTQEVLTNFGIDKMKPNEMLEKSVELGLLDGVKDAIKLGVDYKYGNGIFFVKSCQLGHYDIVEYFISIGYTDAINFGLRYACNKDHIDIVKLLLDNGGDIHFDDDYCLRIATEYYYFNLVIFLLKNGANIHSNDDWCIKKVNSGKAGYTKFKNLFNKYLSTNESIKHLLVGPTEDEVWTKIKRLSPYNLLIKSCKSGLLKGVKLAIDRGVDIHINNDEPLLVSLTYAKLTGNYIVYNYLWFEYKREEWKANESIKHLLVGPTKDEIWKSFGYDKSFDTPEEFLLYISNDLKQHNDKFDYVYWTDKNNNIIFKYVFTGGTLYFNKKLYDVLECLFSINITDFHKIIRNEIVNKLQIDPRTILIMWN